MKYTVNLFYNYYQIGDCLLAIISNEEIPTSSIKRGDVTFIYHEDKLIGINFFNISSICKIKSNGLIHRPPNALVDVLNSLIPDDLDIELVCHNDSLFKIGKILEITENKNNFFVKCDIGNIVHLNCYGNNVPLVLTKCIVALNGALNDKGKLINEVDADGIICLGSDIGDNLMNNEIIYVDANARIGEDFFQMK